MKTRIISLASLNLNVLLILHFAFSHWAQSSILISLRFTSSYNRHQNNASPTVYKMSMCTVLPADVRPHEIQCSSMLYRKTKKATILPNINTTPIMVRSIVYSLNFRSSRQLVNFRLYAYPYLTLSIPYSSPAHLRFLLMSTSFTDSRANQKPSTAKTHKD